MTFPTSPAAGPARPVAARFVPDRRYTAVSGLGLLVALAVAALTDDGSGRLLALIAAVMLAVLVGCDLAFSPRLEATSAGIVIRSPFTRAAVTWAQVEAVRVVSRSRLGLRNSALEIDAGDVLAEFTRRTLGLDVTEARDLVLAFAPR